MRLKTLMKRLIMVPALSVWKKYTTLSALLCLLASGVSAQSTVWEDSFIKDSPATSAQCNNWTNFLDQLGDNPFLSVRISGTYDPEGIVINDPVAASALANLLYSRAGGSVTSGGHTWNVYLGCNGSSCVQTGVELSVDGDGCNCASRYVIRPHNGSTLLSWGGINTSTCDDNDTHDGVSQTMRLEFESGAAIVTTGPTDVCEGETVKLSAMTEKCSGQLSYLWNTGETTPEIEVSQTGDYFVTVSGDGGCYGIAKKVHVTVNPNPTVNAGEDQTIACEGSIQLNPTSSTEGQSGITDVTRLCFFDAPGGTENCVFSRDICNDGGEYVNDSEFNRSATVRNPVDLNFFLYYAACTQKTTFQFKVNDHIVGEYVENGSNCYCVNASLNLYPIKFTIPTADFRSYWKSTEENKITVRVTSENLHDQGVYLSGITVEITSLDEFYTWSPAAGLSDPTIKNPVATPLSTTLYTVTYTSGNGCSATDQINVIVDCGSAPVADCKPLTVSTGADCLGHATAADFNDESYDEDGEALTFSVLPAGPYPVGVTDVVFTATDASGESSTCNTTITVINDDPVINSVHPSKSLIEVNNTVTLTTTYTDTNVTSATIDWDDNSGLQTVNNPTKTFKVSHKYKHTGLYSVSVRLEDGCGAETTHVYNYIIVYDEDGGFVTGGGWFNSPAGAYLDKPHASGKAHFNFVTKYKKKGTEVEGKTEFEFKSGKLTFKSKDYQWLVINGNQAIFKGTGKVNDHAGYNFLISVIDDAKNDVEDHHWDDDDCDKDDDYHKKHADKKTNEPKKADRIRVKIWKSTGTLVYDTQVGAQDDAVASTKIDGGSIQIHKAKKKKSDKDSDHLMAGPSPEETTDVYPNPFRQSLTVQFYSTSTENLKMQILDVTGKAVYDQDHAHRSDGLYSVELSDNEGRTGLYILKINQGRKLQVIKLMRK